jgi:glutamate-1-semialdehyde 2,1-aminomutase
MGALRVARGYTGKDAHIMVEGGFHGLFDSVQWQAMVELRPDAEGEPEIRPEGKGVPALLRRLVHLVPLNDANRLEDVMRAHGDEIGAFLIEPIMGNCCSISATRGRCATATRSS